MLESGMAFAALGCASGVAAQGLASFGRQAGAFDALLVDGTIAMPGQVAAFAAASRPLLPVIGIQLDAVAHDGLMSVLARSRAVVGISSGATLFCVERIAWDHGFRLTHRRHHLAGNPGDAACCQDVAGLLAGAHATAALVSPGVRAYRPSRSDGLLHAWVMQKSPSAQLRQGRREA
jgi:hypothetical protein